MVRINLFQGLGAATPATLKALSINLAFHRDIGRIKSFCYLLTNIVTSLFDGFYNVLVIKRIFSKKETILTTLSISMEKTRIRNLQYGPEKRG